MIGLSASCCLFPLIGLLLANRLFDNNLNELKDDQANLNAFLEAHNLHDEFARFVALKDAQPMDVASPEETGNPYQAPQP